MPIDVAAYQAAPALAPDERVAYGPGPDQFGELYLPEGPGPHPGLVLIHGGCWRAKHGLGPLGPVCGALRAAGLIVWSLEYRRIGNGGGWPATFADVAAAADALLTLDVELDRSRVIAAGHSAGGHLALWLAARHRLPEGSPLHTAAPLRLRGVLALAALADLAAAATRGLCGTAVPELLGGSADELPERYREASPAALLPLGVPVRHLVGDQDAIVPPDYLAEHVVAAQATGDDATLVILPDAGHFELVTPGTPAWDAVLAAARELTHR